MEIVAIEEIGKTGRLVIEEGFDLGRDYFKIDKSSSTHTYQAETDRMTKTKKGYKTPVNNKHYDTQQNQSNNPHFGRGRTSQLGYAKRNSNTFRDEIPFDNRRNNAPTNNTFRNGNVRNGQQRIARSPQTQNQNQKYVSKPIKAYRNLTEKERDQLIHMKLEAPSKKSQIEFDKKIQLEKQKQLAVKSSIKKIMGDEDEKKEIKEEIDEALSQHIPKKQFMQPNTGSASTSGALIDLTLIALGVNPDNRNSNIIMVESIGIRANFYNTAGTDNQNYFRTIVFEWNDNSTPTIANILPGIASGAAYCPTSPYDIDYQPLYRVLADETHVVTNVSKQAVVYDKQFKLNKKVIFDPTPGILGYGKVYLLIQGDSLTDTATFYMYNDVRFYDA